MVTRHSTAKSLLFDGSEQDLVNRSVEIATDSGEQLTISFNDFACNDFEDLQLNTGNNDFGAIVKTGGFETDGGFLKLYKGSDNLKLYYYKKDNIIVVLAYGEVQPMRYKLWLEGVWTIS